MPTEYDNRGSFWPCTSVRGPVKIHGVKFYGLIEKLDLPDPKPKTPVYNVVLRSVNSHLTYSCPLFADDTDSKRKAQGSIQLFDEGGEQWVSFYSDGPDPEHPNSAPVSLTFQPKLPKPVTSPAQAPPDAPAPDVPDAPEPGPDNIPF